MIVHTYHHRSSLQFTSLPFKSLHFTSLQIASLHFTFLQITSLHFFPSNHFTSLQISSLHFPSDRFSSLPFKSLHFTSLAFKSLQFTSLPFKSLQFTSFHYTTFPIFHVPALLDVSSPRLKNPSLLTYSFTIPLFTYRRKSPAALQAVVSSLSYLQSSIYRCLFFVSWP